MAVFNEEDKDKITNEDLKPEETNKKLVVIIVLSIIVVIGLIIGSIIYFNNKEKDDSEPEEEIKKPNIVEENKEDTDEEDEVITVASKTYELIFYDIDGTVLKTETTSSLSNINYPSVKSVDGYRYYWEKVNTANGIKFYLKQIKTYTVIFEGINEKIIVDSGGYINKLEYSNLLPGTKFINWIDSNGDVFDFSKPITSDTTIYPKIENISVELKDLSIEGYNIPKGNLIIEEEFTGNNEANISLSGVHPASKDELLDVLGLNTTEVTHIIPLTIWPSASNRNVTCNDVIFSLDGGLTYETDPDSCIETTNGPNLLLLLLLKYEDNMDTEVTLFVKWNGIDINTYKFDIEDLIFEYNITYNDGTDTYNETYTIKTDGTASALKVLSPRENYTYKWFDVTDTSYTNPIATLDNTGGNLELTANWVPVYKIKYEYNTTGIISNDTNIIEYNEYLGTYTLKTDLVNSLAVALEGWYLDDQLTIPITSLDISDFSSLNPGEELTLYAKWKFQIKFDLNGENAIGFSDLFVYTSDSIINLDIYNGENETQDKEIVGWSTSPDGTSSFTYQFNESDISSNKYIVLYAIWEDKII